MPIDTSKFIIPESDLSGVKYAAGLLEKQRERQFEQQKQNRLFNLRQFNELTDFDKYKTGQNAIDAFAQKKLNDIFNKGASDYLNRDPAEAEFLIKRDMNDFLKWHTAINAKNDEITKGLQEFNKTFPNTDLTKASQMAHQLMVSDFLDENGNMKDPSQIDLSKNYIGKISEPDNLLKLVNDISPAQKYYTSANSESQPFHQSEFSNVRGVTSREKFSGYLSPDKQYITSDEKGNPVIDVKNEIVPGITKGQFLNIGKSTTNNEPLKLIDNNQYKNIIQNPSLYISFLKKWQIDDSPEGMAAREQQYAKVHNGQPMDDEYKQIAFRHWLYEDARKNLRMTLSKDMGTGISINVGRSGAEGDLHVRQMYNNIKNRIPPNGDLKFNDLYSDEQEQIGKIPTLMNPQNVKIKFKPDGNIGVYETTKNGEELKSTLTPSMDIPIQPRAKGKEAVIQKINQQGQNQQTKKEIKRADIATKAQAAGYTPAEYEKLLKQKGIKIIE